VAIDDRHRERGDARRARRARVAPPIVVRQQPHRVGDVVVEAGGEAPRRRVERVRERVEERAAERQPQRAQLRTPHALAQRPHGENVDCAAHEAKLAARRLRTAAALLARLRRRREARQRVAEQRQQSAQRGRRAGAQLRGAPRRKAHATSKRLLHAAIFGEVSQRRDKEGDRRDAARRRAWRCRRGGCGGGGSGGGSQRAARR
jgi:hypothetical protein